MTKKLFIVTSVDMSESADGKATVVGVCSTREEAEALVRNEMESYVDDRADNFDLVYVDGRAPEPNIIVDFDAMSVHTDDFSYGCEWNISEYDLELA